MRLDYKVFQLVPCETVPSEDGCEDGTEDSGKTSRNKRRAA